MSRLLKDSAVTFVAEMVMQVVALVSSALTARMLGLEGRGAYFICFSFASLSMLLLGFRWERPTGYFLGKDASTLPTVLGSCFLMTLAAPLLAAGVWLMYPPVIERVLLNHTTHAEITLAIVMVAMLACWQTISAVYAGLREFTARSLFMIVSALCTLAPVAVLAAMGVRGRDALPTYLAGHLCVSGTLYAAWFAYFFVKRRWRLALDWPLIGRMARYSAATYLSVLLNMAAIRFDGFLLNALSTDQAGVGVYSIALPVANILLIVPTIISTVLFTRVAASEAGGSEATARIMRITLLAMLFCGALVAATAWFLLVPIFGEGADAAYTPLLILAPATIFLGLMRIFGSYFDGHGRGLATSLCSLFAAAAVISLDLLLIPKLGVVGLAIGALCGQGLALVAAAIVFCRLAKLSLSAAFLPRADDFRSMRDLALRVMRRAGDAAPGAGT